VLHGQTKVTWSEAEKPIAEELRQVRRVNEESRGAVISRLAGAIRDLPAGENKVRLAYTLSLYSTEGDFGRKVLEGAAGALAIALVETPQPDAEGKPADHYFQLAELSRYMGVKVPLDSPSYTRALTGLELLDQNREKLDFTLKDLSGKEWTLQKLRGQVVLVNFWATWCPPCRVEIPDLDEVYKKFRKRGLVVLGITDETAAKIVPFVREARMQFPVLLDSSGATGKAFEITGIPKSLLYDREGKLVATAIDRQTKRQLLAMLEKAGLK
jgi:peroxiredoxin